MELVYVKITKANKFNKTLDLTEFALYNKNYQLKQIPFGWYKIE